MVNGYGGVDDRRFRATCSRQPDNITARLVAYDHNDLSLQSQISAPVSKATPELTSGPSPVGASGGTLAPAMDPAVTTIQPGGGVVMSMELAWGRFRRAYLRRFRPRYVARMTDRRQGLRGNLPFDPIDSRDVKYYRNQGSYWWADADDPFLWRDSLPFVRVGLAELFVLAGGFLLLAVAMGLFWWPLSLPGLVISALIVWFFRDPRRKVPPGAGTVVAPADGKIVEIVEWDDPVIGPAIRIGIFLSLFNVHANRASLPGRVVAVRYRPGKILNAWRSESSRDNESLDIELSSPDIGGRVIRIRQITGQFARRIVCWARVDDVFARGEMYGMIKLGSRTELVVPRDQTLRIEVKVGDRVLAGSTVMARYEGDA